MKQTIAIYTGIISAAILCASVQTTFAQDTDLPKFPPAEPAPQAPPSEPAAPSAPSAPSPPEKPIAHETNAHAERERIIAELQAQIHELRNQVMELSSQQKRSGGFKPAVRRELTPPFASSRRTSKRPSFSGDFAASEQSGEESSSFPDGADDLFGDSSVVRDQRRSRKDQSNSSAEDPLVIEGGTGERIVIDSEGILTIAGPDGEKIRINTGSGLGKAIGGVIEKSLKQAAQEIETNLDKGKRR